nr:MAG: hypothetical protein [Bacteriophage sp.]
MSVELPKDTEGREIPLDSQVLYDSDGTEFFTDKFMYIRVTDEWWFFGHFGSSTSTHQVVATRLHLSPHDSWEKLLDDLNEAGNARYDEACAYFHRDKDEDGCTSCPGGEDGCARIAMRDIASRIRKLRGED